MKRRSFLRRAVGVLLAPLGLVSTIQSAEADEDRLEQTQERAIQKFMKKFPGGCYLNLVPKGSVPTSIRTGVRYRVKDVLLLRSGTEKWQGKKHDLYICRWEI